MKLAGRILDQFDDTEQHVFRSIFPTQESIPEVVKTATQLSPAARDALTDDLFALVIKQGDEEHRKFACYDAANTVLSTAYFLNQHHLLPEEAQKVAAKNLCAAWEQYGGTPPKSLQKVAGVGSWVANKAWNRVKSNPIGTAMTAMAAPSIIENTGSKMLRQGKMVASSPNPLPDFQLLKNAELANTDAMPLTAPIKGKALPFKEKTSSRRVDVTRMEAPVPVLKKTASRYALPGRYPLDSYSDVAAAVDYFEKYASDFSPMERRTYACNTVPLADSLRIKVGKDMRKYAAASYADTSEFEAAIDQRRMLTDGSMHPLLDKVASAKQYLHPGQFVHLLEQFDKVAALDAYYDRHLSDPYYSTYGEKYAECEDDWSDTIGNLYVTAAELKNLATTKHQVLSSMFDEHFIREFRKDPITIYESMPMDQKKRIIRMANENAPGDGGLTLWSWKTTSSTGSSRPLLRTSVSQR